MDLCKKKASPLPACAGLQAQPLMAAKLLQHLPRDLRVGFVPQLRRPRPAGSRKGAQCRLAKLVPCDLVPEELLAHAAEAGDLLHLAALCSGKHTH